MSSRTEELTTRFLAVAEQEEADRVVKTGQKVLWAFSYQWRAWGLWESSPPIGLFEGERLIGVHAFTTTRDGYVYSQYLVVDPESRRKGAGRVLIDAVIRWANMTGCQRYRNKASLSCDGPAYYRHLGLKPIATNDREEMFDFCIVGCKNLEQALALFREHGHGAVPPAQLAKYERAGRVRIQPPRPRRKAPEPRKRRPARKGR